MLEIKKGNRVVFNILIKDENEDIVDDLSTASEISYMIKDNRTDVNLDAIVTKTVGSGITVDTPSTGYLEIVILPADTESLDVGSKYHAVQIDYSATDIKEINLTYDNTESDGIKITQDVIRT